MAIGCPLPNSKHSVTDISAREVHPTPPPKIWLRQRLRNALPRWKELTNDPFVLSTIEFGWKPRFQYCPTPSCFFAKKRPPVPTDPRNAALCPRCSSPWQHKPPPPNDQQNKPEIHNQDHLEFVDKSIAQLLERGVLRPAAATEVKVIAPLGVDVRPVTGKKRLYYACCYLNRFIKYQHIKFESMQDEGRQVFASESTEARGFTIDLMSAFHLIDVHPDATKYLGVRDRFGNLMVWTGMPFGVSDGPYTFSTLLRCPVTHWRTHLRANIIHLLDDFCGQAPSSSLTKSIALSIVQHLQDLGFILQEEKVQIGMSVFVALGLQVHLPHQRFYLPSTKADFIQTEAAALLDLFNPSLPFLKVCTARQLASLTGKIVSSTLAIGPKARVFSRSLYAAIYTQLPDAPLDIVLRNQPGEHICTRDSKFDKKIYLPFSAVAALTFWSTPGRWNKGYPIAVPHICLPPDGILASDASDSGWGVYLSPSVTQKLSVTQTLEVADYFSSQETTWDSTTREGLAVLRGLHSLAPVMQGDHHFHIHVDNQGLAFILGGLVPSYSSHSDISVEVDPMWHSSQFQGIYGGSRGAYLQWIAEQVFEISDRLAYTFVVIWIPRCRNERADLLSRVAASDFTNYTMPMRTIRDLERKWQISLDIDVFASHSNRRLPKYFSRFFDERALGTDAFQQAWTRQHQLWLHPPYKLIALTCAYARIYRARGILIVPAWRRQLFWQSLLGPACHYPTPARLGGPPFIIDTCFLGRAQDLLYFPEYPRDPKQSLPRGDLWALLVDFDF